MNLDKEFKYGELIARKRIHLKMTQSEVAEGICSVPYISKLENGKLPNENNHIIELLLLKLSININQHLNELTDNYQIIKLIYTNINKKNSEVYDYYWSELKEKRHRFDQHPLNVDYMLIELRYYIEKDNLNLANSIFTEIKTYYKTLSTKQKYYFHYFSGLIFSKQKNVSKGIEHFELAFNIKEESSIEDDNLIYYHLALAYSITNVPSLSLYYAKEALKILQDQLDFANVINCRLIIGINYVRIKKYIKAKNHFQQILNISGTYKDELLISKVYHNLGYLYSKEGNTESALQNYKKSLEYKNENTNLYINTVYFIIKEYIKVNDITNATNYINNVINNSYLCNNYESFVRIQIISYKLHNKDRELENYIQNVATPLFKKNNDTNALAECYQFIAELYEKQFKYKKSNRYYKNALNLLNKGGDYDES